MRFSLTRMVVGLYIYLMGNLLDYLEEYGDVTIHDRPFSDADALVLSQLCYCKFDNLVMGDEPVYLKELITDPDAGNMFADPKYDVENRTLVARMIRGKRFHNIRLFRYVNIIDRKTETQFSAITYILPGGTEFVAFRGTDENMVGWKEDFNLTYMEEIPGQKYACMYLDEVSKLIKGRFYIGGHSKGGHLAIFSAMHAPEQLQKRFIRIYCMDGPGFMEHMMSKEGYARIRDRICKIIPQSSLIGLMQERDNNYKVIHSSRWGIRQHNLFSWQIIDGEIETDFLRDGAKFFADTLSKWLLEIDPESRQKAADIAYQIMTSCDADNRIDFMSNFMKNSGQILAALKDMDPDMAEVMKSLVDSLISEVRRSVTTDIKNGIMTGPYSPPVQEWVDKHVPEILGWFSRKQNKDEQN